jgi:nitrite reductase (NADH) large subunit
MDASMGKVVSSKKPPIIIIGTGSVGVRLVHQLLYLDHDVPIKIFGAEANQPYGREHLQEMLAGKFSEEQIHESSKLPQLDNVQIFLNNPITGIDPKQKTVTDSDGKEHAYSRLVLAVGAKPRILDIPGVEMQNVFNFRNIHDAEAIKSRQVSSRNTVIIGGGQVGLDAAYAMKRHNTEVTVIEKSSRLMHHQLDDHASVYLRLYLDDLDIEVRNNTVVSKIVGETKVKQVVLDDGEVLPCDTVIISVGIEPRLKLAKGAAIAVNKGIIVNKKLRTNIKNIYAVGECTEFKGTVFGSVKPGYEQAEVLAKILLKGNGKYNGSTTTSKLTVVDYPILSIGDNGDLSSNTTEIMYRDIKKMTYRKIVLNNGHLCGVVAAGRWKDSKHLHQLVRKKQYIWPWQKTRFEEMGEL